MLGTEYVNMLRNILKYILSSRNLMLKYCKTKLPVRH